MTTRDMDPKARDSKARAPKARDRNHPNSPAGWIARFRSDRSGNMSMLFAMMAVVLTLSVGAAVDIGRWLHARDQTSGAIDAAVLAGARYLQTNSSDQSGAVNAAKQFYAQNVTSRLPVTDDSVAFAVTDSGAAMTSSGTAYIKTPFLQLANIDKLPLFPNAQAKAQSKIGNKEVALMLDVTGSMCGSQFVSTCTSGSKLDAMKAAATKMINIMLPDGQTNPSAKISIVPFTEDVRLPTTAALNAARGAGLKNCKRLLNGTNKNNCTTAVAGSTDYYLAPCAVERSGTNKYTDVGPSSGNYVMGHYTDNTSGSGANKVGTCTIPAGSEIMPLSNDKTSLLAKINGLVAGGGTAGHLGTTWAWYTLSPNWSTLWPSSAPQAYGASDLRKIAILMTDGQYNTEYDKNGVKTGSTNAGAAVNGTSSVQAAALCTAMKAKGIEIYTIGFGSDIGGPGSPAYTLLSQCADDTTKFYAPVTNDQLQQAFTDIGLKLSDLYLSK
jgi:Flp pilus assembly protein TadG